MANPTLLSRLLCADADKNTIPDTDAGTAGVFSQQYGWQAINSLPLSAGGKAVQRQDFNGVFNLLGGIAFYAQKGYTFEWDITQDYYANCVVTDPLDGNKYNAKNDVAKGGSNPSLDPTNWEKFGTVDLSGKADTNLDNLDNSGKKVLMDYNSPDYDNGIQWSYPTGNTAKSYTAPDDGWLCYTLSAISNSSPAKITINSVDVVVTGSASPSYATTFGGLLRVAKNDSINVTSAYSDSSPQYVTRLYFFPNKEVIS